MNYKELVEKDYVKAFKSNTNIAKDTLKLLKVAIDNWEKVNKKEIPKKEFYDLVHKQIDIRQKALVMLTGNESNDLVQKIIDSNLKNGIEIDVLMDYLPSQLTDLQLAQEVNIFKKDVYTGGQINKQAKAYFEQHFFAMYDPKKLNLLLKD